MAMYDADSNTVSDSGYALDTTSSLAGQPSLLESIGNVITKGVPLTGLSIVNSFANTYIAMANLFGAEIEPLKEEDQLRSVGWNDYADWYAEHEQGVEGAGLLVGSLIPGLAAVKAVKAAQAGRLTEPLARATNLFMSPTSKVINDAKAVIASGDKSLFGNLEAQKFKAITLGFRDQAVQSLAYEVATAATMNQSPILSNDTLLDYATNVIYGMLLGGGIGGVLEGIGTNALINKALVTLDTQTKRMELTTRFGLQPGTEYQGTNIAGDRVIALMDSMEKIRNIAPDTVLGEKKASSTTVNAILDAKKMLQELTPDGDEGLANQVFDTLYKGMNEQTVSKEQVYNQLMRLGSIQRVGEASNIPTEDYFYVNRFSKGATNSLTDLLTNAPVDGADLSLRFQLRPGATKAEFATAADTFEDVNGVSRLKYATAKDAFADGMDLFVTSRNAVQVNPQAPNILGRAPRPGEGRVLTSKEEAVYRKSGQLPADAMPLMSEPIIFRMSDASFLTKVERVVGDFGDVKYNSKGLLYGKELSLQDFDSPLTATTSPIDANARYVWAAKRGIQRGDNIVGTDVPFLEELYRGGLKSGKSWDEYVELLEKRGVTIDGDFNNIPSTPQDMLNIIRNAKNDLIAEVSVTAKPNEISADAIARIANVPEDYLSNGLRANSAAEYMIDPAEYEKAWHAQFTYNVGNVFRQKDGSIVRGLLDSQYRVKAILDAAEATAKKFFGPDAEGFNASEYTAADASIRGVGQGLLSASNADYNSIGQRMERIGKQVTDWIVKRNAGDSNLLVNHANNIRNKPEASAELGAFIFVRRSTGEQYVFLPDQLAAANGLSSNTAVLKKSLSVDGKTGQLMWNKDYVPAGFQSGESAVRGGIRYDVQGNPVTGAPLQYNDIGLKTYYQLSNEVAGFERAQLQINDRRIMERNDWWAGMGLNKQIEPGTLYAPPINTVKYPYFAYVKASRGYAFSDDSVGLITAASRSDLDSKIAALHGDYDIYTKDMGQKFHEVEGDYHYDRNFASNTVNSDLQRRGILNNVFPETRADTILADIVDFNTRQNSRLVRDYVELSNSQLFAELKALGDRFTGAGTSIFGRLPRFIRREVENPYNSYMRTALGLQDNQSYSLWNKSQEMLESYATSAFNAAKSAFFSARAGIIDYDKAVDIMANFGLGNPYASATNAISAYTNIANQLPPTRILSKFVNTANAVQGATAIRLDAFQSLINIVSTPVMMMAEANSAVRNLITTAVPGSQVTTLTPTKLLANSIGNWFNSATRANYLPMYERIGAVRDRSSDYFEAIEAMTLPYGKWSESSVNKAMSTMVDKAAQYTGSNWSEQFVRFAAADTARQIFEAAGNTGRQLEDNISTFVNRVHGNYVSSQRPIAFQGPVGQMMGLFQTYQFNLMQQLFRYVENGEGKTIAMMAGLQSTIFGWQALPGFQMINQHIVGTAAGNPTNADLYSATTSFFDKGLGDWLMYGSLSNILHTGLYGRGDINPRQITVLPINPLDYPAISGAIKFVSNLAGVTGQILQGGNVTQTILNGLEHNGMSRPLSGLGQMMQGYTSTSQGSLISVIPKFSEDGVLGWNDIYTAANIGGRLMGARPLDEAVAMDANYRNTLYAAKDNSRIAALGEVAKSYLHGGDTVPEGLIDSLASRYADAGGYMPRFSQEVMRWSQQANVGRANEIFRQLQNPRNMNLMRIMGGTQLPDYSNTGSTNSTGEQF